MADDKVFGLILGLALGLILGWLIAHKVNEGQPSILSLDRDKEGRIINVARAKP